MKKMKKNVLLIYPENPGTFWNFKYILKFISRKAVFQPLGLLTVASLLPEEWDKRLVDMNVSKLTESDIAWADMILISAMIVQSESANDVIIRCRAQGKTILVGGPLFSARPEDFPFVNHIFVGEAENTLPQFIKDFEIGKTKRIYQSDDWPDITKTPTPMWTLLNLNDYVTMTVQFSRGCPFNCEFCDIIIFNGQKTRTKSPEQFVNELEDLYLSGWRGTVFVADDNLIGNKKQVKLMLRALIDWQIKRKYPFKFLTQASINLADDEELLDLMSTANFFKVFLGLETPSNESLEECGKKQNVGSNVALAVKKIHSYGMQVMGGFVIGFDNDSEKIFEQQKFFIESIKVVVAMLGLLTALPGTRLYKRLKEEGRILKESSGNNTGSVMNFIPKMVIDKKLNQKEVLYQYKKLIQTLYGVRSYYKRINDFLQDYEPSVRGGELDWKNFKVFVKSIFYVGIFSPAIFYYWPLLIRTFFLKPKAFSTAVELTIQGHHFRKMSLKL